MKAVTKRQSPSSRQQEKQPELSGWQKLVHGIVRPPRSTVSDPLRNAKSFRMNETVYVRCDYSVAHNNKKIELTVYDPEPKSGWLILYLHGNSSSKVQSYSIREYLPFQFSLAAFDFMGCGRNFEEDTITLGYRQSQQVETVVNFLTQNHYKVVLWGRSMGAVTALRFGKAMAIVADSAFKSFKSLCRQFAKANTPCFVPNCLISCLFPCVFCKVRADIQQKANYDVQTLDIAHSVQNISRHTLLIFLSGDQDVLIDKRNSQKLYELFGGEHKHLQIFTGNHNSKRPPEVLKKVMSLIQQFVQQQEKSVQKNQTLDVINDPKLHLI